MVEKVLLTATVQSHFAIFHKPLIKFLQKNNFEVHIAAKNDLYKKNGLTLTEPDKIFDIPFKRSPFRFQNLIAYIKLIELLKRNNYKIIHCNTPVAGVITRLAAKRFRKKGTKVFYTAHGFHFYKGAPLINWLIYYPVEKFLARYTDKLITINSEDFNLAINKKLKTTIKRIHGVGADSDRFYQISAEEKIKLREQMGFNGNNFICVCVGELNKNKNQETLIKAVPYVIDKIENFLLLLIGDGPNEDKIKRSIRRRGLQDKVKMLGHRNDVDKYLKICDLVLSASIREGLGLNIIEAMMCAKPVIAAKNRGHNELICNFENGLLVNDDDYKGFAEAILTIYNNQNLIQSFINRTREISRLYSSKNVINEIEEIFLK